MSYAVKPPNISKSFKVFLFGSLVSVVGAQADMNDIPWGTPVNLVGASILLVSISMAFLEMNDDT